MKKIKYILIPIILLSMFSCEKFLDVNKDEDLPSASTPNFLLPAVLGNLSTSHFDHGEATAYFTQQVATLSGYHKYKDRWDWVDANRVAQWRRHFHDIGSNALNLINTSIEEGSPNYEAIGRISFALSNLMTTDLFGDMPYTEAYKGNPSPKYDKQEFIYQMVDEELDKGIAAIEAYRASPETCRKLTQAHDNVFGGNMDKWELFAYAIKARALLHMTPNVKNASSDYDAIIENVDKALVSWQNATYDYSVGDGTDMQTNQWGASQADPGWDYANNTLNKSTPTDFFLLNVLNYDNANNIVNDPRQPLLMTPRYDDAAFVEPSYLFIQSGDGKDGTKADSEYPDLYGNYITADDAPMLFFTKEELYFIKAEAAFNKSDAATAYTAYIDGITEHMQHVGVESGDISTYLASPYVAASSAELTISHIMMQKYIALYLQGECWVDMRRYKYDEQIYTGLERPTNLAWYWEDEADDVWIERLPYDTETEEIYNMPTLVELGAYQNPDWLKVKMIWAAK